MSDDASFSHFPSAYEDKYSRKSHFVAIFFIIILVVIVILVGLYFLGATKTGSLNPIKAVNPTPTTTQQLPTATPTPLVLDRSKLEIVVLNGSGVAGAAKGISSLLEDLGYAVKKVGNAEKFDYKDVTIVITKEKSNYLEMLKKDLASKATNIETSIDDTLTTDAEVIVGK